MRNGDLLAQSHSILNRWKNYFCQLLNAHGVNDVRQTEMHIAEPLIHEPSSFELEITTEKLRMYKLPVIDQATGELVQGGRNIFRSETDKLITSIWNKGELPQQWKEPIIVPIYKKGGRTDGREYRAVLLSLLPTTYTILSTVPLSTHI
jgi:hypothetical protein